MDVNRLYETLQRMDTIFSCDDETDAKGCVVVINLETSLASRLPIPAHLLKTYVSGPALGARLWAEYAGESVCDVSSLEKDNPVVLTAGRFALSALPYADTLTITFRSPQNGMVVHHTICGTFARRMMSCRMNAVVITGRSSALCTVELGGGSAMKNPVRSALAYKDLGSFETERLCRIPDSDVIVTGKSAANGILHSCAVFHSRSTGRGGLGYVLGCKGIKAIRVCSGTDESQICTGPYADNLKKERKCSAFENDLKNGQSLCMVQRANQNGSVPVNNFSLRSDPRLFHLYGHEVARRYGSCLDMPSIDETFMLGPNCGCFGMDTIRARWKHCIDLGMDAVSTGNILGAWCSNTMNGQSMCDNNRVFSLMDVMSQDGNSVLYKCPHFSINALECGGTDYRGAFATALSSAMGNLFPVWFEKASTMCRSSYASWCAFNEDIVLSYETYGISSEAVPFSFIEIQKPYVRFIVSHCPSLLKYSEKIFTRPLYLGVFSYLSGRKITFDSFLKKGRMCGRLLYEINRELGAPSPTLPDYFCTDPGSGILGGRVVNFASLMVDYSAIRDCTMAVQG